MGRQILLNFQTNVRLNVSLGEGTQVQAVYNSLARGIDLDPPLIQEQQYRNNLSHPVEIAQGVPQFRTKQGNIYEIEALNTKLQAYGLTGPAQRAPGQQVARSSNEPDDEMSLCLRLRALRGFPDAEGAAPKFRVTAQVRLFDHKKQELVLIVKDRMYLKCLQEQTLAPTGRREE